MACITRHRIIVQSDWNDCLRQKNGKAWISFRRSGLKTVYSELKQLTGVDDNVSVTSSDGFLVKQWTQSRLEVAYEEDSVEVHRQQFRAPSKVFTAIHATKKHLLNLDVTCGGLGVSSGNDGELVVWTTDNGEARRSLSGHFGDVYVCRYFPSGVVLISGGADCRVKIWSAETGECAATLTGHSGGVTDLAIVERGRNVVSVSRDGSCRLWDCGQSSCLATFAVADNHIINGCCLGVPSTDFNLPTSDVSPGDREVLTEGKLLLLACENRSLQAVGLQSRKLIFEKSFESAVNCCTFLTSTLVACGTQDSIVHVLDLRNTSLPVSSVQESRSAILSMLPYKRGLFVTAGDGSCWYSSDVSSGGLPKSVVDFTGPDCDPVYRCCIDNQNLFTCSRDSLVRSYSLSDVSPAN